MRAHTHTHVQTRVTVVTNCVRVCVCVCAAVETRSHVLGSRPRPRHQRSLDSSHHPHNTCSDLKHTRRDQSGRGTLGLCCFGCCWGLAACYWCSGGSVSSQGDETDTYLYAVYYGCGEGQLGSPERQEMIQCIERAFSCMHCTVAAVKAGVGSQTGTS